MKDNMERMEFDKYQMTYVLNEVNVMKSTMLKLGSTTRESKIFTRNFHPILMSLNLSKLGVGNIIVPDLQESALSVHLRKKNTKYNRIGQTLIEYTFSLHLGHSIGRLYPSGRETRQVGASSGQCLSRCS
jgi:hypothetical protein